MFRYKERNENMAYINEIFEKATVRGFADYLLFGLKPKKNIEIMRKDWKNHTNALKGFSHNMIKRNIRNCWIYQMKLQAKPQVSTWR